LAGFSDAEDYDLELAVWNSKPGEEDGSDPGMENIEAEELVRWSPASDVYAFACLCLEVRYNDKLRTPLLTSHFVRSTLVKVMLIVMTPTVFKSFTING
jgi:hypothetical protein